ncbi:MAG: glucosidase [Methylotenera sp.]|uniref:MGH1-like glycoside hydrolase domain-containing protein n=1 Tax=Methylotenera sp. TaxID=2051956 RepID=UPI002486FEDC|nr:glucosidase [Methylotenera sp.]MDI1309294.1 glucosidase [Methylotenera sp.]
MDAAKNKPDTSLLGKVGMFAQHLFHGDLAATERQRLEAQRQGQENWRLWGPYLAERAWGTVREDYSADGTAWEHFSHDQSRARAYRWSEDGLGGICDEQQRLCFALTLWNGVDPILKERAFGLTGNQGNHGEDVKEAYFYLDATPSHSFLRYHYKYPQRAFPYSQLVEENARRTRDDPPYNLIDTGAFADNHYWDIEVAYAKADVGQIHVRITASNRGAEAAVLHLLPTLWCRNTWGWGEGAEGKPELMLGKTPLGAAWAVRAVVDGLGEYYCYGREVAQPLFTENDSNTQALWGQPNRAPYVKNAFHHRVVHGDEQAVNPAHTGTKFAAWHTHMVEAHQSVTLELVLSDKALNGPFSVTAEVFNQREVEANAFYRSLLPAETASDEARNILRQALAGMIWNKQFYHFDVARWLDGDIVQPPESRKTGRNRQWRHFHAADVMSVPDSWEFPWFAAWDLAFHTIPLALVDIDFAKQQLEILLREDTLHPNGQIPAYEWAFGDVNPPVHAMAVLKVFRMEREQRGHGDLGFLRRAMHKLLLNYTWWLNAKDADGNGVFEGGFLGLDNISVYDRSQPLPEGYRLKQADATGWVAMFALNMTMIALELATEEPDYEDIALQCYSQFLSMANVMAGNVDGSPSLWDSDDGFFKDILITPDGSRHRIDVFSMVGIIPLFACEVVEPRLLKTSPRFEKMLMAHMGGMFDGHTICACPAHTNERGEHLLSLANHLMLPPVLKHLMNENEFLSPHGIRSVSRIHTMHHDLGWLPAIGRALIEYLPGESNTGLFGGNSNWRGPVWMPVNYLLIETMMKFHHYMGENFKVEVPYLDNREMTLHEVSCLLADRIAGVFQRDTGGNIAAFTTDSPFQSDPHWQNLLQFNEYYHGETGQGLGASHQTGWTGLVANLLLMRQQKGD